MRLFFYYTFHSFVNAIRKVLKTWVAIMLACLLLGGLVGLGVGVLLPDSKADMLTLIVLPVKTIRKRRSVLLSKTERVLPILPVLRK